MNNKLKEAVHYICEKIDDPTKLGKTKLNKILWYADREYYKYHGKSITGGSYIKLQYGPVPEDIDKIIDALVKNDDIATKTRDYYGKTKHEYFSITEPDISKFKADEIDTLTKYIDLITNEYTAKSISEDSHDDIWRIANIGEKIPLSTSYVSIGGEITIDDIEEMNRYYASRS